METRPSPQRFGRRMISFEQRGDQPPGQDGRDADFELNER